VLTQVTVVCREDREGVLDQVMVSLEDHIQEVLVLDVLDPVWVYTFISVEIKSVSGETFMSSRFTSVTVSVFHNTDTF